MPWWRATAATSLADRAERVEPGPSIHYPLAGWVEGKVDIPVGKNIQRLRIQRGWTQEVLADFADVSVRWLSKVESGASGMNIGLDFLVKIAEALDVEVVDLLKGEGGRTVRPRVADAGLAGSRRDRASAAAGISDQGQRARISTAVGFTAG